MLYANNKPSKYDNDPAGASLLSQCHSALRPRYGYLLGSTARATALAFWANNTNKWVSHPNDTHKGQWSGRGTTVQHTLECHEYACPCMNSMTAGKWSQCSKMNCVYDAASPPLLSGRLFGVPGGWPFSITTYRYGCSFNQFR